MSWQLSVVIGLLLASNAAVLATWQWKLRIQPFFWAYIAIVLFGMVGDMVDENETMFRLEWGSGAPGGVSPKIVKVLMALWAMLSGLALLLMAGTSDGSSGADTEACVRRRRTPER